MKFITSLEPNQVFIFGTNCDGFHGGGAAGYAFMGDTRAYYNNKEFFNKAVRSSINDPIRIGKWCILGQARGLMQGTEGMSYGIVTIIKPSQTGGKRSYPLEEIKKEIVELFKFAENRPELEFLASEIGSVLAGWSKAEMLSVWHDAENEFGHKPSNIIYPENFYE